MARALRTSRPKRWAEAVSKAEKALSTIDSAYGDLESALQDLKGIQEEYGEWKDNLPDSLQGSAVGDKLDAIVDLNIPDDPRESTYSELEDLIGEADSIDLPMGFGRD